MNTRGCEIDPEKRKRLHICITIAVMLYIFIHSAMPGELSGAESGFVVRIITALTGIDSAYTELAVRKAAHFTEFAMLGICLAVNMDDLLKSSVSADRPVGSDAVLKKWTRLSPAVTWITGTLYAASDEIHQYFVPERACSIIDVCIDSAGVVSGMLLFYAVRHIRERFAEKKNTV